MQTEQLDRAFASTRAVLAKVTADQLDAPTPCVSWDVRALINHFVGSARWAATGVASARMVGNADYAAGDFLASYDESVAFALEAFGVPGALERTIALEFGEMSGGALMRLSAREQFTHGWDLARALGHHTDLDPSLAAEMLDQARAEIGEAFRGPDGTAFFGPIAEAPPTACPADRLAAYLGRAL